MTNVIITRHYNGFTNVADTFSLGNHEVEGNAAASLYRLPVGYSVTNGYIYDSSDIECAITGEAGRVVLVSRAGYCADAVLKAAR